MKLGDLIRFRPKAKNERTRIEWSPPALIISEQTEWVPDDSDEVLYIAICDGAKVLVNSESDEIEIIKKVEAEIP